MDAKRCPCCGLTKPLTEWSRNRAQRDGLSTWCLSCKRDEQATRVARNRALIHAAKARPCADCGVQHPYYVMDLDHLDASTKVDKLSTLVTGSTARVIAELEKVEAVCANCHRYRGAKRGGWA